jgi:catechol 2,3-dioxygenase-like lactoylglutathione lyase family enzyme
MAKFMHVGVPTSKVQENETYLEDLKVYVTSPDNHELKFEYLRYEEGTPLPEAMQKNPHVAFQVDSIEEMSKGAEIIVEPFQADENTKIAFIVKDGVVFELMECK